MPNKQNLFIGVALLVLLAGLAGSPAAPTQAQQQNLLTNPGFDLPYNNGAANGWNAWFEDSGQLCATKPDSWDFACRPGFGEEMDYNGLGLTQGSPSQHVGAQYIPWHAGVFQTVTAPAGSRVRFTVSGYSRSSQEQPPAPSDGGRPPRMQVGIDPEGSGLWNAPTVSWSGEVNAMDSWQTLSIEATVGAGGKVTVFTSSKFRGAVPLAHHDSWWDGARLEVIDTPTATPAPQPTAAPQPTLQYTPTPRPDGAVVHIVQAGDTLFGIALQYGVDVDELRRLNAGTLGPNDLINVGDEIIISGAPLAQASPTPQPTEATPEVQPTQDPAATPEEPTLAAPAGDAATLCVSAYHDRNADMLQQSDTEELLPNAMISLVGTDGPAGTYTTDGISEPYCFQNLAPGNYVLRQTPPAGYTTSGPGEMGVALGGGQVYALQIGYVRGEAVTEQAPVEPGEVEETPDEGASSSLNKTLNTIIQVSGIIVLVLALVVGGLFIASRRRS
ncbi:MAG: LysM peptidoglycan-binding domain-containing protein [Anaerolineae bacterium]|nr:LysM peptidoglycan-binding domain-containing protein [Anaerolineae bacterium]